MGKKNKDSCTQSSIKYVGGNLLSQEEKAVVIASYVLDAMICAYIIVASLFTAYVFFLPAVAKWQLTLYGFGFV